LKKPTIKELVELLTVKALSSSLSTQGGKKNIPVKISSGYCSSHVQSGESLIFVFLFTFLSTLSASLFVAMTSASLPQLFPLEPDFPASD
jgi:hypothetical protein